MVQKITEIHQKGRHGVYLGIPETFIGSKVATLNYLDSRVDGKFNAWNTRYLSQSGKEVLIKVVALAFPPIPCIVSKSLKRSVQR